MVIYMNGHFVAIDGTLSWILDEIETDYTSIKALRKSRHRIPGGPYISKNQCLD